MGHVIFKGQGISSHMATKPSVESILNLFISATENGIQDCKSMFETYKYLDKVVEKKQIQRPIVVLSDGHSSRFSCDTFSFMFQKLLKMFVGRPDTTGQTQLLDQINHSLHDAYRREKIEQFMQFKSVNRTGFLDILAGIRSSWASKDSIIGAGKRVGINATGLKVNWMQQEKFAIVEALLSGNEGPLTSTPVPVVASPQNGSAEYYKQKAEYYKQKLQELCDSSIDLEAAGILTTKRIQPKDKSKSTKLTNKCGSMEGQGILNLLQTAQKEKEIKENKKKVMMEKKEKLKLAFLICKDNCICEINRCAAWGLKQCGKAICNKNGKPTMIIPKCNVKKPILKCKLQFVESDSEDYEEDQEDDDKDDEEEDDEEEDEENDGDTSLDHEDRCFNQKGESSETKNV